MPPKQKSVIEDAAELDVSTATRKRSIAPKNEESKTPAKDKTRQKSKSVVR